MSMSVSYVVTIYNKAAFVQDVITSLIAEHDSNTTLNREYIFVDDGSTDDSVHVLRTLTPQLSGTVKIIEQANSGAAHATNVGVHAARHPWIRLVDGDDIVCKNSTHVMVHLAIKEKVYFVLGGHSFFSQTQDLLPQIKTTQADTYTVVPREEGIKSLIRNFPYNSSTMLISKELFMRMGGSDIRLISPDYTLATRAVVQEERFIKLHTDVAQIVEVAEGRLSSQIARSRFESILAIYYLAHELLPKRRDVAIAVYKRACSRSYRYARHLNNKPLKHFLRLMRSRILPPPRDLKAATLMCLTAYTPDHSTQRPQAWIPKISQGEQT